MKIADLLVCTSLDSFDEEAKKPQQDKNDDQNREKLWSLISNQNNEVLVPVMGKNIGEAFFLRNPLRG
jgi:hypothetical protein